jgi:ribosomal protein S18 acetylase RimI-like enzyme
MEDAYRAAGVTRFAAWAHESDEAMRLDLERRGYHLDVTTRAMGISLDELHGPEHELELVPTTWPEYLEAFHLHPGLLVRADHSVLRIAVAGLDGERVSTAMAFDHEGDCGIYNVETLVRARRRGLATALTTLHLRAAVARGCRTASLQATAAARRV